MRATLFFLFAIIAAAAFADSAPVGADEEAELRAEFDAMDLDKDGLIDRRELSQMDDAPEESDIDEFIMSFDQDGDGKISYEEIIDDAMNNPGNDDGEVE
mmetsp:Transcript_4577/g.11803  ORF Transcript_4577/g.11803 Transcript_4577/m.11803 type:complete len:100 (+) Transcript_4577:23-322(+)